jgi:Flp pilus assembly protein TadD
MQSGFFHLGMKEYHRCLGGISCRLLCYAFAGMRVAAWMALISVLAAQDFPTAVSAFENGKYEDAAKALSEILGRTPDDPDANYYLGMTYFRQGRPRDAMPFLERATRLSPSQSSAWKALGLVLLGANDYRAASVPLGKACALEPNDEDNCYLQARSLFVLGQYDQALKPFEKAMHAAPPAKQAAVHRATALNQVELGMTQEADRHFRDAVRLYRASPEAPQPDPRLDYGAFLIRQGRTQIALEMLRQSVSASPTSPRAHAELGRALLELDRPAEAATELKSSVDLDPNGWTVRLMLGRAYLMLGRAEEGQRELNLGREGWARQDYGSSKVK